MNNTLGINKPAKNTKVVVAMSGGVDSSVAAGLMKKAGYDVVGITLKLYDDAKKSSNGRQCCAGQDIQDAKRVADKLNIKHEILYYQKKFKSEVIDSFIDSYVAGETPIPCVQCNQTVKFRDLFKYAKDLRADALITGHYVSRKENGKQPSMYRAKDYNRDQSYFLFSTTQEQLNFLRFPLGQLEKSSTRELANSLELNVADKPDSQDICFVPNGDYSQIIKKFRPQSFEKGDILNIKGEKIGNHEGIVNYTIGQRRGIKIADKEPLYVVKIDSEKNTIIVGTKKNLIVNKILLKNINILGEENDFKRDLRVKVRSTGKLLKAKINFQKKGASVEILDEETGISPGQACVFYLKDTYGDKVLGGGWIDKTYNNNLST
ncbi:tRNA 2-thiouridylase [SAR11 cluster bacterium PRT-SC02]|jgi:tRNA-specific 2-thiouridylase|nr:tRNA 2-thiouridylase [SAR11 cluster bacterium PRT-SC02]